MIRTEYTSSLSYRSYVCFLIFSHSTFDVGRCRVGKAAPNFLVATKPLSEPYKRISQTYGSSVNRG
jgi:hypothetical protein